MSSSKSIFRAQPVLWRSETTLSQSLAGSYSLRVSSSVLTLIIMLTLCATGFSDPVYAEAFVNIQQFDILLGELTCV